MLSAIYEKIKSLFGIETESRKRRIESPDCTEIPQNKIRRTDNPLGASNFSSPNRHSTPAMSSYDVRKWMLKRECPEVEFAWEKKSTGKENQFAWSSDHQRSDPDIVVLEDDSEEPVDSKQCRRKMASVGASKCKKGSNFKGQLQSNARQIHRKSQALKGEEVSLVEEDEDVMFIKESSGAEARGAYPSRLPQAVHHTERRKDQQWFTLDDSGPTGKWKRGQTMNPPMGSLFSLGQQSHEQFGFSSGRKEMPGINKLDSPSIKARIRTGNLSRAAILKKSLPPPPTYFGVEPKLSTRWAGLDDKMRKKSSALALCSAIDEMKAYNHMLHQFTSESASKQMSTRFDMQAYKMFESQLKRNYSYSQFLKKRTGTEKPRIVDTIDLSKSDDDVQEVEVLDESNAWFPKKQLPENSDAVQILPRKVDVQRTRERTPKASGETAERDKPQPWKPPNAVEQMIKKSHVTEEEFVQGILERYANEKSEIDREVEKEHTKKKLLSERRQKFEGSLEERLKRYMKITEVVLADVPAPEEAEVLPELTDEMLDAVHDALRKSRSCVLARLGANTITGADIQTLADSNWLNDEVINNYMDMLTQRGQGNEYPSVYCFNTFFYPKLSRSGYSSIRRWTKKVDIFQKEMLIIPLHLEIHWALAVVDFRQKTICYYDSMNGRKNHILQLTLKYLQEEKSDKKKENFDTSGWQVKLVQDIPQQRNGYDCGVFACMFAEHLCRGVLTDGKKSSKCSRSYPPFPFSQDNMTYFRKRMIYEILSGKLLQ